MEDITHLTRFPPIYGKFLPCGLVPSDGLLLQRGGFRLQVEETALSISRSPYLVSRVAWERALKVNVRDRPSTPEVGFQPGRGRV